MLAGCDGGSDPAAVTGPTGLEGEGTLQVTVETTGRDLDETGYDIKGAFGVRHLADDDAFTLEHVPAIRQRLYIADVAFNCKVSGDVVKYVDVPADGMAQLDFPVTCFENGILRVNTTLMGTHPVMASIGVYNAVGQVVAGTGPSFNSTVSIRVPPGELTVSVGGLASYDGRRCASDSTHVQMPEAGDLLVDLNLDCR
jgi:hypothetical protein